MLTDKVGACIDFVDNSMWLLPKHKMHSWIMPLLYTGSCRLTLYMVNQLHETFQKQSSLCLKSMVTSFNSMLVATATYRQDLLATTDH